MRQNFEGMEFSFAKVAVEIRELIFNPKGFWASQKEEEKSASLFVLYLSPLLVVLGVAVFVGEFFSRSDFFFEYPALIAVREIILFILQYFIGVFLTKVLMKTFGGEENIDLARKLVFYSMVPLLLISILTGLFQFFSDLNILGFYGVYIFWVGVKKLLVFPENKDHSYILIAILLNLFVFSFLSLSLSKITEHIFLIL